MRRKIEWKEESEWICVTSRACQSFPRALTAAEGEKTLMQCNNFIWALTTVSHLWDFLRHLQLVNYLLHVTKHGRKKHTFGLQCIGRSLMKPNVNPGIGFMANILICCWFCLLTLPSCLPFILTVSAKYTFPQYKFYQHNNSHVRLIILLLLVYLFNQNAVLIHVDCCQAYVNES